MEIYSRNDVIGRQISLNTSKEKHISGEEVSGLSSDPEQAFTDVLFNAVNSVNSLQNEATDLQQKLVLAPEEVNISEVMIATEKARLSISFFKTITEKAIKAYNEIMIIR